jgi:hypothetical protein
VQGWYPRAIHKKVREHFRGSRTHRRVRSLQSLVPKMFSLMENIALFLLMVTVFEGDIFIAAVTVSFANIFID